MHLDAAQLLKFQRLTIGLVVFKFNNYSALKHNVSISFANGFAVILSAVALSVFYK